MLSTYWKMYSDFMGGPNFEPRAPLNESLLTSLFGHLQRCGLPFFADSVRIINGEDAPEKAWPWQVFLDIPLPRGEFAHCGGSLISEYWILTAANCIHQVDHVIVYLGVRNATDREDGPNVQVRTSVNLIPHAGYSMLHHVRDIGLVKMNEPAVLNHHVSPICLPDEGDSFEANDKCYLTGWGKVHLAMLAHNDIHEEILQQTNVHVMPQSICAYSSALSDDVIDGGVLCFDLHDDKRGPCFGDSGSPLSCLDPKKERYVLAGISATMGDFCSYRHVPAIGTRVSEFIDWIVQEMDQNP
ncbi:unnamed protein product [Lymnaea stagnalis]|uniref:Peptidase S1 domain-containing protein n=1 Tax=Lymnaea stagnalis TaxID=6523 RepID=A0AAV2IB60_LYMST